MTVYLKSREFVSWLRASGFVGSGTVLVGAAGYAFVSLVGYTLAPDEAAAVSSYYLLINIIGPGIFFAVEQETSRATSTATSADQDVRDVVRQAFRRAFTLLACVLSGLTLFAPILIAGSLLGHGELFVALVIGATTAASVYAVRGVLSGMRNYRTYGMTLVGEGLVRLIPAVLLGAAGVTVGAWYALAFSLGSGVGALAGLRAVGISRGFYRRKPVVRYSHCEDIESATPTRIRVGLLVVATLLTQVMGNLAPIVVTARLVHDPILASTFASAFIMVRIPLFMFSPVQALLLPPVSSAVTAGDYRFIYKTLWLVFVVVVTIGSGGVAAAGSLGPKMVTVLFGGRIELSGMVLALLSVSTIILMLAQFLQTILIAHREHRVVATSWVSGIVVLAVALLVPPDPITSAIIAQIAGCSVVSIGMIRGLRYRRRR